MNNIISLIQRGFSLLFFSNDPLRIALTRTHLEYFPSKPDISKDTDLPGK